MGSPTGHWSDQAAKSPTLRSSRNLGKDRIVIRQILVRPARYLLAAAFCLLALATARIFNAPSSCFVLAVMASSLYAGRGPAVFAVLLCGAAFEALFYRPRPEFLPGHAPLLRIGILVGAMLLALAIAEAKKRSDRVRFQVQEDFRALAQTSPDCIVSMDAAGLIRFVNSAVLDLFGYSPKQVEGQPISLLIPELTAGSAPDGEFKALRGDGCQFDVEATCGSFGDKTTIFLRDISDRKRAEQKLLESEDNLRLTLETLPGLVYTRSPEGEIEYVNGRVLEYFGCVTGESAKAALSESIHPNERSAVLRQIETGFAAALPYTIEYRSRRQDGVYRWLQSSHRPLRNAEGRVVRWYGLLTDVDDLRAAEETVRRTEAQLGKAARIAAVSELSASIVHEISQPISAMVANGQASLRWLDAVPARADGARAAVERIIRDGKDASSIIGGLRSLYRHSPPVKTPLHLQQIVAELMALIRGRVEREQVALHIAVPDDLPAILGDRVQLQQLLSNLTSNALDAMEGNAGKPKHLSIRAHFDGEFVLAEFADSGAGIPDPDKIFDAFFTTKEAGLGMGLPICRSIVEAHGGRLWASAAPEGGAVFSFTIAAATQASHAV